MMYVRSSLMFKGTPERAFENNWLNEERSLNISKLDFIKLLWIATKHQLFQFEGNLYQQVDGVSEGSPLSPLMANNCMYISVSYTHLTLPTKLEV